MPAEINILLYKGADRELNFVVTSGGAPYPFTGTNTLRLFRKHETTPFLIVAMVWDGTKYEATITSAQSALMNAIEYPFEWRVVNGVDITFPVKGSVWVSDVFTTNTFEEDHALDVDPITYEITVSQFNFIVNHNDTLLRDAADCHTIGATTGLQAALDAEGDITLFRDITADYTLLAADNGYWINAEHAVTDINVTIPVGLTGQKPITIQKMGAADVIINGAAVTLTGDVNITTQYHIIVLVNKGANVWTAIGGVT